jgi:uncharacterized protein (DUF885 family)
MSNLFSYLAMTAIVASVVLNGSSLADESSEDAKLTDFFREHLDEAFALRPMEATQLGDHRFDHLLDDLSPAARGEWVTLAQRTLEALPQRVDRAKLSRSGQIDYEIFEHHLKRSLWIWENARPYETDPRIYTDYVTNGVYLLLTQSTLPREKNIENCIARMAFAPRVLAAARESLDHPPRVTTETAIKQNRGAIGFFERDIYEVAGVAPQVTALAAACRPVVEALKEHQRYLEEELLRKADGEWRIGREKFVEKLELELDAGLSADEVLAEAEAEFARVERDMYVIARQLWGQLFPNQTLPVDDEAGRRETIQRVLAKTNQEHARPEELTEETRATVARIKEFIADRGILTLPDPDRCQIIEMPEFQRGNSVAYLNQAPPLDPMADSVYAVSPPPGDWSASRVESFMHEYNRRMLQILTIHEAYPGHYVQLEYSNRHPSLIRKVLSSGVFAEGWAVYTEQMMLDQGYGDGDLALRLNQLKFYLRAVANAILDHKLHCGLMSDDEALSFMIDRAFQSEGEAVGKLVRAKQTSCQLSTYFVGRTAFYRLRQQVQRQRGEQFDLGKFHEEVLGHGTLPVKYLPELVAKER